MNALARMLKLSIKVTNEMGVIWQHQFYKSQFFCKIYNICSYVDNILSKYKMKFIPKNIDYVICDRWVNDIVIDLGTETHDVNFLETKWHEWFQKLLPENSLQFLIERNKEDILKCRIENQVDPNFPFRYELYTKLHDKQNIIVIDNSDTIKNSVNQIKNYLF
jgi:thymidylate kinase